jgi:hypothetical protein
VLFVDARELIGWLGHVGLLLLAGGSNDFGGPPGPPPGGGHVDAYRAVQFKVDNHLVC